MMSVFQFGRRAAAATVVFVLVLAASAQAQQPGQVIRDCADCPEMVVIPAGSFMMGADKNFEEAADNETPRHRVTIARPFAIGRYEVTQAEWVAVMGSNPSKFKGRSLPVEQVSWHDVQSFIQRLNAKTGQRYRLPTEAEWEYAARAGTDSAYSFGDDKGLLSRHGWFDGNSGSETHPVGQLQPNRFGLHDMHGNVLEWVEDCWHDSYGGAPSDGSAWTTGECKSRVLRGGSWFTDPWVLRSALRSNIEPGYRSYVVGFRLARTF